MNSSKKKITNDDNTTTSHKKASKKLTNKDDLNPSIKSLNERDVKIKDEIDEIFSKARNKAIIPTTSSTSLMEDLTSSTVVDSSIKEKGNPLNDKEFEFKVPAIPGKSRKRKLQENDLKIIPSSLSTSSTTNTTTEEFVFKVPAIPDKSKNKKLRENDIDGFSDSRGTKSRKTTEDGFAIYDIKELNIGNGGDTPLCPIDCDCCESLSSNMTLFFV
ncbi:22076_t:CDS:2 [Cetraspora pellucida]|uniref:22076_t:CDS:1 n=1 Tax=Cetraspora pellucida TaxID=1433469 RepID=A0A9N9HBT0_9GLOM|nr:22076_t:CDS:2 [Cetraspora pellucida]